MYCSYFFILLGYGILIEEGEKDMNNLGTDISVATEILAMKFSKNMFNKEEVKRILKEKELVSLGDRETIERVINVYGREIKEESKNGEF